MLQDDFILGDGAVSLLRRASRCGAEAEEETGGPPIIRHLLQVSGRLCSREPACSINPSRPARRAPFSGTLAIYRIETFHATVISLFLKARVSYFSKSIYV